MALYIQTDKRSYDWHVGEPSPVNYGLVENVNQVQANGDELEHIEQMFHGNFPIPNQRVCRWFGDYARMIVGNL